MTQEEKLKEAKRLYKTANADQKYVLESLFPELKESEDERIRKAIIDGFKRYDDGALFNGCLVRDIIAWLEKQGEHAKFINGIQVGDKVTRNKDGVLVNLSQLNRVAKKDEKQGEQKPVEPQQDMLSQEKYAKAVDECYGEQKPWSEEDEVRFESCIKTLQTSDGYDTINVKWLKSIKERVQPQPKQEWSEEDERCLTNAIDACKQMSDEDYDYSQSYIDAINFLKSLKDRYTWKPSDEQMEYLAKAITTLGNEGDNKTSAILYELRTDLKKLKV